MADGTKIEWTDATWNVVNGCSVVSPGCTNCYAMKLAGTRLRNVESRKGLTVDTKAGPVWTGEVRFNEPVLLDPLRWKRPRKIFVCAHGDLFHESVPDDVIDRVFAVMALAPQHSFQVLTKRTGRMRKYMLGSWQPRLFPYLRKWTKRPEGHGVSLETVNGVLPNVWLGTSVEDQKRADERRDALAQTPAAARFVSYEPALGPVDWTGWEFLDWLIAGGESGQGARPSHPDWHRAARDFCAAHHIAFLFKQHGAFATVYDRDVDDPDWRRCNQVECATPRGQWLNLAGGRGFHGDRVLRVEPVGKKTAGRLLDGVEHNGFPA